VAREHAGPGRFALATAHPVLVLLPLLGLLLLVAVVFPERQDDEAGYLELARNLASGHYATGRPDALLDADPSYPDLWFGPGLPLVLLGPVAAGLPIELVRLTGPLLLFAALLVFYALLRRSVRPGIALAATWALGLYLPFFTVLTNLHSEPLAVLFVVAAMYATARLLEDGQILWLVAGGAALAGLALTRVDYGWVHTVLLTAALVWWAVSRRAAPRRVAAMLALSLVLCLPWLAYTASETDRLFVWGNSGSLSLYWMSSPEPGDHGDWQQANDVFTDRNLAAHRPVFERLRGLELPAQNAELERRALENVVEHPLAYAENVAANVSRMFFDAPYSYAEQRPSALFFALPNSLLLGAALLAGFVAVRARGALSTTAIVFAAFALTSLGLHALVAAYPRMLMPIVPVIVWFAATVCAAHVRLTGRTLRTARDAADEKGSSGDPVTTTTDRRP
jgi:4-amino-4-deoxy-L-arabinose transferase-like glycosyltransferase